VAAGFITAMDGGVTNAGALYIAANSDFYIAEPALGVTTRFAGLASRDVRRWTVGAQHEVALVASPGALYGIEKVNGTWTITQFNTTFDPVQLAISPVTDVGFSTQIFATTTAGGVAVYNETSSLNVGTGVVTIGLVARPDLGLPSSAFLY